MGDTRHLLLIDPDEQGREMLAGRLRMQGYTVAVAADPAEGAVSALSSPPAAVVADLWMPSISGVQLCRLLKAEPATENVPVVLRGPDDRRNRFWAERAGAAEYVVKGRMGDLVRALGRVVAAARPDDGFFIHLSGQATEIRDRIASYLDQALFESVIAAEVRALSLCEEFPRLFDLLTQFMCRVMSYRWLALTTEAPNRFALHANPALRQAAEEEARAALGATGDAAFMVVEDEDADDAPSGPAPIVCPIRFIDHSMGRLAVAPRVPLDAQEQAIVTTAARELGGPIRMASLVEQARRVATVDPLTSLLNRRAFLAALDTEMDRSRRLNYPLSIMMLDVDHFKQVNDRYGHAAGDAVLVAVARLLGSQLRKVDMVARWGGEEFIIALTGTGAEGAAAVGERLRARLEATTIAGADGVPLRVTASFGAALWRIDQTAEAVIDRADRAMYNAKHGGRNRVCIDAELTTVERLPAA